jgi:alpha-tubulin suppressor-like RCC1 family protein
MIGAAGQVAPTFTTQPISQTGAIGGNMTFTVAASGTAPLAYQWYKDGIAVAGATGSSLTISGLKLSDGGSYQASVTNVANRIKAVSAGGSHTMYVKTDGTLWAMGDYQYGQLGDGYIYSVDSLTPRSSPLQVATGVASVAAGSRHTMYVKTDGTLWAMGYKRNGQLGDEGTDSSILEFRSTPVQVATGVSSVAAGAYHSMYVKTDGTLWATGSNAQGQLGDGGNYTRNTPVQVATGVSSVAAGSVHTMFVKTDGTLWATGDNRYGQLGDGTRTDRSTPVQVATGVSSVAAGRDYTLYVKTDGTLWAMGDNGGGKLGDGTTTHRSSAVQVATSVASVSAGGSHTMFVKTDGTLWAAGSNSSGELGDGTTTNRSMLVQVTTGVASVSAGASPSADPHTMFVKTDGTLWATGSNSRGELGDGTTTNRSTPVNIYKGLLSNAATLAFLPAITTQLNSSSVTEGSAASFSVVAISSASLTYQWRKDGSPISGATSSTYSISSTSKSDAGSYSVVVTNYAGSVTSSAATLTVTANAPRLSNLSVRTALGANQIVIVGVTMSGGAKSVLLRAAGPTLSVFGVPDVMADPKLDLYSGSTKVTTNDNWGGSTTLSSAFQSIGAFAYSSTASLDAALVTSIDGGRTVQVSGPTAGTVLVEGYDAGSGDTQRFTNLSARNKVGTGANILIAGFTLAGSGTRSLLIRAVGPKLSAFGVTGVLTDPKLEIYSGSTIVAANDNWSSSLAATFSSVGAFGLTADSKDAAITVSLPAGGYTVQVSGADGGVGEAIVEIYELP